MKGTTRGAVWIVRAAFVAALAVELFALHFPAPDGVTRTGRAGDVNRAWSTAGDVARAGGRFVPDAVDAVLDPFVDDKLAHFVLFLPLGVLAAAERRLHGPLGRRRVAAILLGLVLYAIAGELAQGLFGRFPELGDCVANALGALVGVGAVALFTRAPAPRAALAEVRYNRERSGDGSLGEELR